MPIALPTETRWGDQRRADSDFAREQILNAACQCYRRSGVGKTTMEHIARETRVTRTTIYRYFQSRDEVLTKVIVRETGVVALALQEQVAPIADFGEFLAAAVAGALERLTASPLLQLVLNEENAVLHRLYVRSEEVHAMASTFVEERFERARSAGQLREGIELPALGEWIVRIISAYLLAPAKLRSASTDMRAHLRQFLVPAIVRDC